MGSFLSPPPLSHTFSRNRKIQIMKKIKAAKARNTTCRILDTGNEGTTRSKGEIDGLDGRDRTGSEETKGKRRTENDGGKSERDEKIRKDKRVGPSLDECEFHRVAIELLRKPVALSCHGTYTHLKMARYHIEEVNGSTQEDGKGLPWPPRRSISLSLSSPAASILACTRQPVSPDRGQDVAYGALTC